MRAWSSVATLRTARRVLLPGLVLVAGAACADYVLGPDSPRRVVRAIQLSAVQLTLDDGDSTQLTATVLDQLGQPFEQLPAGVRVEWSSAAPEIAGVSPAGVVTGNQPGQTQITALAVADAGSVSLAAGVVVRAVPRSMVILSGDGQVGVVGDPLAEPLRVRLTDRSGNPVPGDTVTFTVAAGGGSLDTTAVATDSSGVAAVRLTLGTAMGPHAVEARTARLPQAVARFAATAAAGPAAALEKLAGDAQTGTAGAELAASLVVRVADGYGNGVTGATVDWAVTGGGGSLSAASAVSDTAGRASVRWILGTGAGTQTVSAGVGGLPAVTFTATAGSVVPVASVDVTPVSATVASGTTQQLTATPRDAGGNPLTGRVVTWTSGNTGVATVDGTGLLRGVLVGATTITATVEGVNGTAAVTVTPGAASGLEFTVQPSTTPAGQAITPAVAVTVRDAAGNVVPTLPNPVTVALGSNPGGATLDGTTVVDVVGGVATFADLTVSAAGVGYTLVASAPGLTGATSAVFTVTAVGAIVLDIPGPDVIGVGLTNPLDVTLGAPAGAGGVTVTVTSDAPGTVTVAAPGTVVIAEGETTGRIVLTGVANGTTTVRAAAAGYTTGTLSVQVSAQLVPIGAVGVSAGKDHTCALRSNGTLACWGWNGEGRLGDGTTALSRLTPVPVATALSFAAVSAGGHTCALTAGGAAYCWGDNTYGQLGTGSFTSSNTPVAVAGGLQFASIRAGVGFTCGLTTGGAAYCWGNGSNGKLGDSTGLGRETPTPVAGGHTFAHLSLFGDNHVCAVTTGGQASCWGYNFDGAIGDGTTENRLAPTPVSGALGFAQAASGWFHSCARTPSGRAYCWGDNNAFQLGWGNPPQDEVAPGAVQGGLTFSTLTAGGGQTCGLVASGAAYCWGYNGFGGLGDGTYTWRLTPMPVIGGLLFTELSAGGGWACGRATDGQLYCWGGNWTGQLGDGTLDDRLTPTRVPLDPATQLAFTVQPSATAAGQIITPAVEVTARDALGYVVPMIPNPVTIAIGANPGGATLSGTTVVDVANGLASFGDLRLSAPGVGYTLVATSPGLTGVTSTPFDVTAPPASGVVSWVNPAGGAWSEPSNWSTGTVPGPADTAVINLAGTYTVSEVDGVVTVDRIVLGDDGYSGGTMTLALSVVTLTAQGGVAVTPGGVLDMTGGSVAGAAGVRNDGTVILRDFNGSVATLTTGVSGGGSLLVRGLGGITGPISTENSTMIDIASEAADSAVLTVANGFEMRGQIVLSNRDPATPRPAILEVTSGSLRLEEPGDLLVEFGTAGGNRTLRAELDAGYRVQVDHPLVLDRPSAAHRNGGYIEVTGGDLTFVQTGTNPSFSNTFAINIGSGHTLTVDGGTFTHTGALQGTGTLNVGTATVIHGGTLSPLNFGTPGTLNVTGDLPHGANALLLIDARGTTPGVDYDQLVVSGTATLNGSLQVELMNGFVPAVGDSFTILTATNVVGTFATLYLPTLPSRAWNVSYTGTSVVLTVVP